ncbi:bone morphogenetic protein 4 isoform X2 [Denticeps clupeoides]|nr:bone morphogenetic protein 4-like isoform X2 [Denticeps clupeoides]
MGEATENKDLGKAILEMLHIDKLSAPQQAKPHPYMRQMYQLLYAQEAGKMGGEDGTLVQSFRSIQGSKYGSPAWIWFNISHLKSSMTVAELVLLRKTIHPEPLSVTVAVHSMSVATGSINVSAPLVERLLTLDQQPPLGFDVFNVSEVLVQQRGSTEVLGFQLRYHDESGSLVFHEALTQSFYCLNGSSLSQPLLVVYRTHPQQHHRSAAGVMVQRQHQQYFTTQVGQDKHFLSGRPRRHEHCRVHYHYVDFHKSELALWIIQPEGFNASVCRGSCYTGAHTEKKSRQARRNSASCTAQELSSLMVMYRTEGDNIFIEEFGQARAESCVCQSNV